MLKKIQLTLKRSVGSFFYFYDVQATDALIQIIISHKTAVCAPSKQDKI